MVKCRELWIIANMHQAFSTRRIALACFFFDHRRQKSLDICRGLLLLGASFKVVRQLGVGIAAVQQTSLDDGELHGRKGSASFRMMAIIIVSAQRRISQFPLCHIIVHWDFGMIDKHG
jgi:hypothetical protein